MTSLSQILKNDNYPRVAPFKNDFVFPLGKECTAKKS